MHRTCGINKIGLGVIFGLTERQERTFFKNAPGKAVVIIACYSIFLYR